MKIEVLYPDIANLFGEMGHIDFIRNIFPYAQLVKTHITEKPRFLTEKIDLIYLGPMAEKYQEQIIEKWLPYKAKINEKIEEGNIFLFIGNAMEVLFEYIEKDNGEKINGLGIFSYYAKRQMMSRINSLYHGKYKNDIEIIGFKTQFTYAHPIKANVPYLFETIRGLGMDKETKNEGIHYKNFYGTYLIGPLLIMNPDFTIDFMKNFVENPKLEYYKEMKEAFNIRLEEFKDSKTTL
ncbi:hypothetical protein [Helcococcus ovis]|uniref:hypothetical protein n=1 Tax=Helcococcus ovis TaxID=72026 RepID=UPI0010701F78|nr:hypothetical protein [Helcococcus ovis]TFF67607.1 hypothetical protein EQF93_05050 [Helcococcus ovis]WNZ00973.1 hypothetical protein EQF90_006815 [Helcococcus ovis]